MTFGAESSVYFEETVAIAANEPQIQTFAEWRGAQVGTATRRSSELIMNCDQSDSDDVSHCSWDPLSPIALPCSILGSHACPLEPRRARASRGLSAP